MSVYKHRERTNRLLLRFLFIVTIISCSYSVNAIIIINPPPIVSFSGAPNPVCSGDSVYFTNTTTNATTYAWTFPGGTPGTSALKNPAVDYATAGTYNVILWATGAGGTTKDTSYNLITVATCTSIPGIAINTTGAAPDNSAMLDLNTGNSGHQGFLPPKAALTSTTDNATILGPNKSLLVYNPGTGGLTPAGIYYNSGTGAAPNWVTFGGPVWFCLGNPTPVDNDFLGTTDNKSLTFKADGVVSGLLDVTNLNTAFGYNCVYGTLQNTIIGAQADNTASYCTGIGEEVFAVGNTANYSVGIGAGLNSYENTGKNNTAVGYDALYGGASNNKAPSNTCAGFSAFYTNVNAAGGENTSFGYDAEYNSNKAYGNTYVGSNAGFTTTTGQNNVAIGYWNFYALTNAVSSTSFGVYGAGINTTGSGITAYGDSAGVSTKTGSDNTFLGYNADASSAALTNATSIGDTATVHNSNSMKFGNAKVLNWYFGAATPVAGEALIVGTNGTNGNGANLSASGTWNSTSDRNKKENFINVDEEDILNKISILPITKWNYKGDRRHKHIGPMAQDFYRIFKVGNDSVTISMIDPAGVAFIGIKALNSKLKEHSKNQQDIKLGIDQLKAEAAACSNNQQEDVLMNNTDAELRDLKEKIHTLYHNQNNAKQ